MDVAELDRSLERGIAALIVTVWRHKLIFITTSALVFATILFGVLSLQPVYEGATLLIGGQRDLEQVPDGTRKPVENSSLLARMAESEEVVSAAIAQIGLPALVDNLRPNASIFARLRHELLPRAPEPLHSYSLLEEYLPKIKKSLSVRGEQESGIIRIAYRNADPEVAAAFANALAKAFVDRQLALYGRPGAADFFLRQRQRFDDEVRRAADALQKFSIATGIYAVGDQRTLLLKRLNDLAAGLAHTREKIADEMGQRDGLIAELRKLAPVARSPFVSGLVEAFSSGRAGAPASAPTSPPADQHMLDDRAADPPLLLVKVYQDSMVLLFKSNADIVGLQNLEGQQMAETAKLTSQLNALTVNEEKFEALRRAVVQATHNSTINADRMTEEQMNAASAAAKFSSVKILQPAIVPLRPVFPNYLLFTLADGIISALAGMCAASLRRARHPAHAYRASATAA